MMYPPYNPKEVGANLSRLVLSQYKSERQFCRDCVIRQNLPPNDEEIHKMQDRFSHIKRGTRNIQIEDLLLFSDLLGVSCDRILLGTPSEPPSVSPFPNRHADIFVRYEDYCAGLEVFSGEPEENAEPETAAVPAESADPAAPVESAESTDPAAPVESAEPTESADPAAPVESAESADPSQPEGKKPKRLFFFFKRK